MSALVPAAAIFSALLLAGCPRSHEGPPSHTLPAVTGSSTLPAPTSERSGARWVPRVGTWAITPAEMRKDTRAYGPMANNFGSHATSYLGHRTVALVDKGKRWLWRDGALTAIDRDGARGLETIDRAPIGFVLTGTGGVFHARAFDAPLVQLARDPDALVGIGPRCVLLKSGFVGFDGAPIPGAPKDASALVAHSRGFGVAATQGSLWFTRDCRAWSRISATPSSVIVEDGDSLLVASESSSVRIRESGVATAVTLTEAQLYAARLTSSRGGALADDGFEGSLIDGGWSETGEPGRYFRVTGRDIDVMTMRDHAVRRIGTTNEDGCAALMLDRPLVACTAIAQRLRSYRVDLATGSLALEREIAAKPGSGWVRFMGVPRNNAWPPALLITASCAGDPAHDVCVRDAHGGWTTLPNPDGNAWIFPGEAFHFEPGPHGTFALHDSRRLVSSVTPPARLVPPPDAGRIEDYVTVDVGALRTSSEVVVFEGPNPSIPIPPDAVSYAIHYPVAATPTTATVTTVRGVVAAAGRHALRLDGDVLYETSDGWRTWTRVPPPPTGPLTSLADAQCGESGCLVGAWDRLGWSSP